MNLSIVIPCLNEETAIPIVVPTIYKELQSLSSNGHIDNYEVVVVNDGSTDGSMSALQVFSDLIIINHSRNCGYGASIKSGIKNAQYEFVLTLDMDNTYPPKDFIKFILESKRSQCDYIVGIRNHNQSGMPALRSFGNQFFTELTKVLFSKSLKDPCSGMWLFKKDIIKKNLEQFPNKLQFTLFLTLFLTRKKIDFKQISIDYLDREGESKLNPFKDGLMFLFLILKTRFIN